MDLNLIASSIANFQHADFDTLNAMNCAQLREYLRKITAIGIMINTASYKYHQLEIEVSNLLHQSVMNERAKIDADEQKNLVEVKAEFDATQNAGLIKQIIEKYIARLDGKEPFSYTSSNSPDMVKIRFFHKNKSYILNVDMLSGTLSRGKQVLGNVLVDPFRVMMLRMTKDWDPPTI